MELSVLVLQTGKVMTQLMELTEFTSLITKVNASMVTGTENSPMLKMELQQNQSLDQMDTPGLS